MIRWLFHNLRFILIAIGLWLFASHAISQNVFSSEDDMKKQANKLFDDEEYAKAYPLFSQLLSLYPKDPQYNYKFGTCLLFAGNDKGKAIPYIEFAANRQKQGVDKEVFFFLAKTYHLNYRFSDAIRIYTRYKGMASSKMVEKFDVDRQIEMCQNGMRLLKSVTELSVLEKKEVPASDFFRSYNLTEFNAKIIVKPEDLKTSLDKKKKDEGVMYLAPDRNQIYFSSYGDNGKSGRDIYYVTRTPGGDLSAPVRVSDVINTKYDEDFPFLHPNGRVLYFCSKGHNSMGGYDIFKSEWDDKINAWGKPVNMDFAINTPDDDILFVSDKEDKTAYFSSRRESAEGNITVYKIKLERKPLDISIIKGTLAKQVGDKVPNAKITVTKLAKEDVVGVFNSNSADGTYTLSLPNGGKFMFTVESSGFKKSSELVSIPVQREIKPLKQQISLVNVNGQDKIVITNEFDTQVDSADLELAIQYIKAKASLDVAPAEEEITAVAVEENNAPTLKGENKDNSSLQGGGQKGVTPVSNTDIIAMAYQDAKETQKDVNDLVRSSEAAQQLANQKNELSVQKNKDANELMKSAELITNQQEKMAQTDKAAELKKESEKLSKEAALSFTLSNQMENQAKAKQEQADAEMKYAKDLDNTIKAGANEKKMNELLAQKEKLDKRNDSLDTSYPPDMNKMAQEKQTEAGKSIAKYLDIQQDVEDMQVESKRLRTEAEKTKNEGARQNLNQQAEDMEKETESKKKDAETYFVKGKQLQAQADSIKSSASLTSSVMKQIQSTSEKTTALIKADQPQDTKMTMLELPETKNTSADNATQSVTPSSPQPLVITSAYVGVFVKQIQDVNKKEKELDREEAKAVIYQSWTDSLDNQITSLHKQLASATVEEHKAQIKNKILELQSSVDDKRQKASDSRNKVDNLKLQEALAAASAISSETTAVVKAEAPEVVTANATEPENLTGTNNINDYYEAKLKENEKVTNEYEKKSKEKELYSDWSSSLYDESLRLKKDGKGGKAEEADKESKSKQVLAMQRADEVTQLKAEHPELVLVPADKMPEKDETENKSTTETSSAIQNSANTTGSLTNQTETEKQNTVSANSLPATPASSISENTGSVQEGVSPVIQAVVVPESLKNKPEYTHYASLKNESDWNKKNAARQYKQADDVQKTADEQFKESQKLSQQIAITNDPDIQKELTQKSDELDKRSLRNQAKADSLKKIAQNSEAEANSKRAESELYLQSLDKATYEEITSVIANKPDAVTTSTPTTEGGVPVQQPIGNAAASTETTNPVSVPTSTEISGTQTVTPVSTEAKSETNPESGIQRTATTVISLADPTETAKTQTISSTNSTISEPATGINIEPQNQSISASPLPSVNKVEPTFSAGVETQRPAQGTGLTQPTPSAELLKYYDALFDKLELAGVSYSPSKPIPVDAPMPDGLIFKVQIGAFKNDIPQDLFKGIKPITSENTQKGFERYTAGLFRKFETANNAKNQVKELGYRDAFVVAFFNGKRISINDGLAKAKEAGENIDAMDNGQQLMANGNPSTIIRQPSASDDATTTDVKSVSGLFYAIQIGAFSNPVSARQLYNLSPLNSERTDNGLIRYTTGRFDDEAKASREKNTITQKGITDAFVIAYYNGKRIDLNAAKEMIDAKGKDILVKDTQEHPFVPSDTTTSESSAALLTTSSNKGIVFKVQIGAFKEQVPIAVANKFISIVKRGIKTFKGENGLMVYTVGEFLEYESANNLKKELINEGLSGAFVIAFQDGKKMSAAEALDLIKNK
ncbi:MAG: PD40 domain-containing protein [Bacteroidetes bacterium]|nr:PD40 domain-containing protein [Bacteroidota bacterium]